jgi:hypothetical protein
MSIATNILGIIDKMRIEVYQKKDFTGNKKTILVQVNPEKYTIKQQIAYAEGQTIGSIGSDLKFSKIEPEEVSFEFLFDSTGILPRAKFEESNGFSSNKITTALKSVTPTIVNPFKKAQSIDEDVNKFKGYLMGYNSSTHQTNYILLIWGTYSLKCRLKGMDIEYTHFTRDGKPIRARAKCTFKATMSQKQMDKEKQNQSPDITHERNFGQSDTLTLLAEDIYQSNSYYTDVARANKLMSFRKIDTGKPLFFPPLK